MNHPLQPYLGARAHLSLSWLSQPFLALLLLAVAFIALLYAVPPVVAAAKSEIESSCKAVEAAAGVVVSIPHYMADSVNLINAKSINAVINGAGYVIDISLRIIIAIAGFLIDIYRSLTLCFIELAVRASLGLLIDATQEISEFVTKAFGEIREQIQNAVGTINSGLTHTIGLIDKIPGVNIDPPQIDVPSLNALQNVTLPSGILNSLQSLNNSIPTMDEIKDRITGVITAPLTELRVLVNETMRNSSVSPHLLPVPPTQTVEICSQLDTSFVDEVGHTMATFAKISLGLTAGLMLLLFIACYLWERYRYQAFLEAVDRARLLWIGNSKNNQSSLIETLNFPNLLSFLAATGNPLVAVVVAFFAVTFHLTPAATSSLFWFFAYITYPPALMFLALGVIGLITVQIQLFFLNGLVRKIANQKAAEGAEDFSDSVSGIINNKMQDMSYNFANDTNRVIDNVQDKLNNDLFGWVNTTTVSMNTTVNQFYDGLTQEIENVFQGTPLTKWVQQLVYCLIGSKVDMLSNAFTFIHDNAHVSLPNISPDILMLSKNRTDDLTASMTSPNSTVSTQSVVDKMIDRYMSSLENQRLGFIICICIWILVVIMASVGVFVAHKRFKKNEQLGIVAPVHPMDEKPMDEMKEFRSDPLYSPAPNATIHSTTPSLFGWLSSTVKSKQKHTDSKLKRDISLPFNHAPDPFADPSLTSQKPWSFAPSKVDFKPFTTISFAQFKSKSEFDNDTNTDTQHLSSDQTLNRVVPAQSGVTSQIRHRFESVMQKSLGIVNNLKSSSSPESSCFYEDKAKRKIRFNSVPEVWPAVSPTRLERVSSRDQDGFYPVQNLISPRLHPVGSNFADDFNEPVRVSRLPPLVSGQSVYTNYDKNPFASPFDGPGKT